MVWIFILTLIALAGVTAVLAIGGGPDPSSLRAAAPLLDGAWRFHTGDDPNWGGPMPRHDGRSAVLFMDAHVVSLKPFSWYWSLSPWLKPDVGGS